jgi:hypothetical protein
MDKERDRARQGSFAWQRISPFKDWFELRAGGRVLATLTLGGLAITTARVQTNDRHLVFTAEGIGNQRIRISDSTSDTLIVAYFERRSGHAGTLRFVDGGHLEWRRTGWWKPTYAFTDRWGNPLARFHPDGRVADYVPSEDPGSSTGGWQDLLLLLALGWFLLVITGGALPPKLTSPVVQ